MLAHIAGVPVEETAFTFAPVAAFAGGLAALRLRQVVECVRERRAPQEKKKL